MIVMSCWNKDGKFFIKLREVCMNVLENEVQRLRRQKTHHESRCNQTKTPPSGIHMHMLQDTPPVFGITSASTSTNGHAPTCFVFLPDLAGLNHGHDTSAAHRPPIIATATAASPDDRIMPPWISTTVWRIQIVASVTRK